MNDHLESLAQAARKTAVGVDGQRAFAALAQAAGPVAYRIGRSILGDESLANDVMQESLLKLAAKLISYDPGRPFGPWLIQIATRTALDLHRRENLVRRLPLTAAADLPAGLADRPDEIVAEISMRALLDRIVAELSPHQRAVFVLRDLEGYLVPEIAGVMGLTVSTVRVHLARARKKVRSRWRALHQSEGNADEM